MAKRIIVCDRDYFPLLFRLKASHPGEDWKILQKEDLLDRVSFPFTKDPIPYLLRQGIDYDNAKKYLRLLRVADVTKNPRLEAMLDDLSGQGFLSHDELGRLELSRGEVALLEMAEDEEVHALLKRQGIAFTDIELEDLGAKPIHDEKDHPPILSFPNKFAQYFHIYSDIRKAILEDESNKGRVSVLINDESDLYYVNLVSRLFGLPSYATFLRPFLSQQKIKQKVGEIYRVKAFSFTEEEVADPELSELVRLVSHYGLSELPFGFAYASLLEIANTLGVKETIDDRGIVIENRYLLDPSMRIYVTNFQYDAFYKVYDDKNVLTDEELLAVDANPSYVKTRLDRRKKWNYIRYNDIAFLSRVRQHLTDKIYDSPFIQEFGWKDDVMKTGMNEEGAYTSAAGRLYLADQLDKVFYPRPFGTYKSHDHAFKGINRQVFSSSRNWSITNLETYIQCPYKYYLTKVLPEQDDDKHAMWRGTLIHKVMEHVLSATFDFDEAFSEGKEEYEKSMTRCGASLGPKEEAWLTVTKTWLKEVVEAIRGSKDSMALREEIPEHKVTFKLAGSHGETYTFANAKIDKILVTEADDQRFYTILDYKTGKESFRVKHVFLGPSSQLPLYYYALSESLDQDRRTAGARFGGFGILHCFSASPKNIYADEGFLAKDNIRSLIRVGGVFRDDVSYWESMDPSRFTKDGKVGKSASDYFAQGLLFEDEAGEETLVKGSSMPYNVEAVRDDAKKAMVQAIEKILANEFPIAPTSFNLTPVDGTGLVCSSCPYGDICYRNAKKDSVSYAFAIQERFFPDRVGDIDEEEGADDEL